jgi:hypothetical protein
VSDGLRLAPDEFVSGHMIIFLKRMARWPLCPEAFIGRRCLSPGGTNNPPTTRNPTAQDPTDLPMHTGTPKELDIICMASLSIRKPAWLPGQLARWPGAKSQAPSEAVGGLCRRPRTSTTNKGSE